MHDNIKGNSDSEFVLDTDNCFTYNAPYSSPVFTLDK